MRSATSLVSLITRWTTILLAGVIGMACAILFSLVRPLEYSSTTRILITQDLGAVDAYTASRSAERIADELASIVYTSTFYDKVMSSGYAIDTTYFPESEIKLRKKWEKTVAASVSRSSGLLTVRVC